MKHTTKRLPREYLTPAEAASLIGVKQDTVRSWISSGELPASDLRSRGSIRPRYRIRRADLDAFMERRQVVQPARRQQQRKRDTTGVIEFF